MQATAQTPPANPFVQNEMLRFYEDVFVPAFFGRWAELLVSRIPAGKYETIVDVATGPGTVIAPLRRAFPQANIIGTDPSEGFLDIARRKHTLIEFIRAGSEALPFKSETVDLLTCQQGTQYFSDKLTSLKEMTRILKVGGRMALAVWAGIEHSPQFFLYKEAMGKAGASTEALGMVEIPFSWSSRAILEEHLATCGLKIKYCETIQSPSEYPDFATVVAGAFGAPFGPHLTQMNDSGKQLFEQTLREKAEAYRAGNRYLFPISSHILIAEK